MDKIFSAADILMPKNVNMEAWSVVACDQHTSDKDYWNKLRDLVGEKLSTLNLIVPEAFLQNDVENLIARANENMIKVLNSGNLQEFKNSLIYVERSLSNGKIRKGIVGKIDLENYSINMLDNAKIKPSEQIVESRVPTRIKIRKNASLDLPHILLFCDDKNKEIIEPLHNNLKPEQIIYDFDLNMDGGKIRGFLLNAEQIKVIENKMNELILKRETGIVVADGNHSLVAAKRVYEEVKATDLNYLNSPKRYALAEVVNVYDEAIDIEPIHRVLKGVNCEHLFETMKKELAALNENSKLKTIVQIVYNGLEYDMAIKLKENELVVEKIQQFLDAYTIKNGGEIDYIHEADKLKDMCKQKNTFGILFAPIVKEDIFKVISHKKLFPRKTFSIGTSLDKRYYLECRKLF